ncbi:O-antigen ligase family protein [Actinoplanes sp. NBRC 103695]|uniref:O-antigen ligase family protein n=1 Tax=Actinoplanes sp. NBRC 103695 TaxID=3032202 RepID=UPI0024A54E78|nr:O-antigen ligase family protein [Actinoplanes sp. NBRC 103695]GLZ01386.1 hypothetical protein Acsp02_86370 [Actinoplanes sp. NBRC 103695]
MAIQLLQMLSFFWAPPGARIIISLTNIFALITLLLVTAALVGPSPEKAARVILFAMLLAGIVYILGALAAGPGPQGRYSAFGGGPNVFARILCLGVIASISLSFSYRRRSLLLPIPLLLGGTFLSGSRGAIVSLVGAATVAFVIVFRRIRLSLLLLISALGTGLAAVAWNVLNGHTSLSARYSSDSLADTDYSHRPELLAYARDVFYENPVFGAGLDGFFAKVGNSIGIAYPHNLFMSVAAETGLAGLALVAVALIAVVRDLASQRRFTSARLGIAMCALYVGIASMFSGDYYDARFMWICLIVATSSAAWTDGKTRLFTRDPVDQLAPGKGSAAHKGDLA